MSNVASPSGKGGSLECIDLETLGSLIEQSEIVSRLDLGLAIVYRVNHPTRGALALVNTVGEQHAVIQG